VVWINDDSAPHTITADDGSFDSGSIGKNSEFKHTFHQPGSYSYHCAIHPSMTGKITVIEGKRDPSSDPSAPMVGLIPVANELVAPMGLATTGDGRLFIIDQTGIVKVMLANGTVLDDPFMDVQDRMVKISPFYDERGLLGLAFHPQYATNGLVYIMYSAPLRPGAPEGWDCTNRISEFKISGNDPNQVDTSTERVLLEIDKPQMNHNGGTIAFGPDGYLYVPLGDGGGANDVDLGHAPDGNAQNTSTILGKILRIDVNRQSDNKAYGIPEDNPFVGKEGSLPEIWAYGFRNPWRITFDKEGDQSLYTSDAGQSLWEEVDLVTKAGNYGWNIREGTHCFDPNNPDKSPATCPERGALGEPLINPIIEYGHDLGKVIVGGYIYRGEAMPELQGKYIFADWSNRFAKGNGTLLVAAPSSGGLWKLQEIKIAGRPSGRIGSFIRSLGQDDSGEIYVLTSDMAGPANQTGKVFKIVPA
jgi:glucose/arabinose dehydrogenase